MKKFQLGSLISLIFCALTVFAGRPIFIITPIETPPPFIITGQIAAVKYNVTNNTPYTLTNIGAIALPAGVSAVQSAPGDCAIPFSLASGQSCVLHLVVNADAMVSPSIGLVPKVCYSVQNPIYCAQATAVVNIQTNRDINAILNKPIFRNGIWGLRLVDPATNQVLIDLNPHRLFFIGSERKLFTVWELLNEVGPGFTYDTPVYKQGDVVNGLLDGDLILQASGDLTMGGRTLPNGQIAITEFDHNEANALGNAILTSPDPLAGYKSLAQQVAAAGISEISGEVIIDDRLFEPFNFRDQFDVRPIFVNDDAVDVIMAPGVVNHLASVNWRPLSEAFTLNSTLMTTAPGTATAVDLTPEFPACFGTPGCSGSVSGSLAANFLPPLTNSFPFIQIFRITNPSNYARTILIEALREAGVTVNADTVAENPVHLLPAPNSYNPSDKLAELIGLPYSEYAKYILRVSYNIGADISLMLYGLTQNVSNFNAALALEKNQLIHRYHLPANQFFFPDGNGGGETRASNSVITQWLSIVASSSVFNVFFNALPVLSEIDPSYPSLAGAIGKVRYKTGTYLVAQNQGLLLRGSSLAGYVDTAKGHRLLLQIVVNDVPVHSIPEVLAIAREQRTIAAIFWRDY